MEQCLTLPLGSDSCMRLLEAVGVPCGDGAIFYKLMSELNHSSDLLSQDHFPNLFSLIQFKASAPQ